MGGTSSKPPLRTIIHDASLVDGVNEGDDDVEEESQGIDQLGVINVEDNYPEPSPRSREHVTDVQDRDVDQMDTSVHDHETPTVISMVTSPRLFLSPHPRVPVGTSLKRHFKKSEDASAEKPKISTSPFPSHKPRFSPIPELPEEASIPVDISPRIATELRLDLSQSLPGSVMDSSQRTDGKSVKRLMMLKQRERLEKSVLVRSPQSPTTERRGQVMGPLYTRAPRSSTEIKHATEASDQPQSTNQKPYQNAEMQKSHRAETFISIATDLTKDLMSERQKVKAILFWISQQQIGRLEFAPVPLPPDSPNGYMQLIQEGKGTFPVLFTLLCRAADIQCAIVNGISKGSHYVVGSHDMKDLANTWNAVYVDGSWELVHTLWVCKGLLGRSEPGWQTIETNTNHGNISHVNLGDITGKEIPAFVEYFIFTRPEEFIYRNFPDDPKWQLLDEPFTQERFLSCSYLRPNFFRSGFELLSEDQCSFMSDKGKPCNVEIGFKSSTNDIMFGYELRYKEGSTLKGTNSVNTRDSQLQKRYVLMIKDDNKVSFEVRFCKRGTYILRIFGGVCPVVDVLPPWIMDVRFQCNNVAKTTRPLPFDPGFVGWGPGSVSERMGLFVASHQRQFVSLVEDDGVCIQFVVQKNLEISVDILQNGKESDQLGHTLTVEVKKTEDIYELVIYIRVSGEEMEMIEADEPALKVDVRKSNGEFVNACNYLIYRQENKEHESFYVRRARRQLREAMQKIQPDTLEMAVNECVERGMLDTDPDLSGARVRLEYLQCRRDLKTALLVNRIDLAEYALHRTRSAKLHVLLKRDMMRVSAHLEHLLRLDADGWLYDIPDIDRMSLTEIGHLRKPKAEVQLTAVAMYMLLGVKEDELTTWARIQQLLNDQESTLIEMARLEKYIESGESDLLTVDAGVRTRVLQILSAFTETEVRRIDNTAVAFYIWAKSVVEKLPENLPVQETKEIERKDKPSKLVVRLQRRKSSKAMSPTQKAEDTHITAKSRVQTGSTKLNTKSLSIRSAVNSVRSFKNDLPPITESKASYKNTADGKLLRQETKPDIDEAKPKTGPKRQTSARSRISKHSAIQNTNQIINHQPDSANVRRPPTLKKQISVSTKPVEKKQEQTSLTSTTTTPIVPSNFREDSDPFGVRDKLNHSQLSIKVNKPRQQSGRVTPRKP